jgi:hypothetical protein
MHLIPNARLVLRKAWSVRLLALQILIFGAAQGLFAIWPGLTDYLSPPVLIWGAIVLGVMTLAARFILQPEVRE